MIALITSVALIGYGLASLRRLAVRDREARRRLREHQRGRWLRWEFTHLGATFIKIGQVMSSRHDLFAPGVIAELQVLQDRVPPFAFHHVRALIERELGGPLGTWFREFSPMPVAAGSVAQVHRAVLHTGEEVAVKVLRPDVLTQARRDGRILMWLSHLSHTVSARARTANVVGHVRNLVAGILAQTDLRRERHSYARFRRNFADTAGLRFPRVHSQLTTRCVLTMEFIYGVRVEDAHVDHLPQVSRVIRNMFFAMCFDHGFVHADLHPGNVLVGPTGEVIVLDVGMVKRLSRTLLAQIVDFTRCLAMGSGHDLVAHLQQYHRYLDGTDWAAVEVDATAFIRHLRFRPIAELELSTIISELFTIARKHRIRPMPEVTLVLLGMVTTEGMAKRLDPTVDMFAELARFLGSRASRTPPTHARMARGSREWKTPPLGADQVLLPTPTPAPAPPRAASPGVLNDTPPAGAKLRS
ncbi:MAG: AarF/UbiB family protein [Proteobacteria bacterium]|nr:AarF/UbiB family protein [Pseudomonadota bacterium]